MSGHAQKMIASVCICTQTEDFSGPEVICLEALTTLRLRLLSQPTCNSFMTPLKGSHAHQSFTWLSSNVGRSPPTPMTTCLNKILGVINHLRRPAELSGNLRCHSSENLQFINTPNALKPIGKNRCPNLYFYPM